MECLLVCQDLIYNVKCRLNEVKPVMIQEETRKAREVAGKFASDSETKLGRIKKVSQGKFSIFTRDKNNTHIKSYE
jgi:hypothetical protein